MSSYLNATVPEDEWTEILITQDNVSLTNFTIRDNGASQGSGAWQVPVTFVSNASNNFIWNNLRAGTVIMLHHRQLSSTGVPWPIDNSRADGYLEASANDGAYFSGGNFTPTGSLSIGSNGEFVQLRNTSAVSVHVLGQRSTPGADWPNLPIPKLNHEIVNLAVSAVISVCPGNTINEYGYNAPQTGTTYTCKSQAYITKGLPNDTAALTGNSDFWRSLRQPAWNSPVLNATLTLPSTVNLSWNACTDPYPTDNTTGYMLLRNTTSNFTSPSDGHTYAVGDMIGTSAVIAQISPSTTTNYTDTYIINCGDTVYYRIYAYRFGTDGPNGNDYNPARGRAYNETNFGAATIGIPDAPVVTNVVPTDASCGNDNGSITITATGGTAPLSYSIDYGTTWQASPVFSNLASGSYFVMITDVNNCDVPYASNPVIIYMIPAPETPDSATVDRNNLCADDTGDIVLSAHGGSGLQLEWFTGSCGGTLIGTGNDQTLPSPVVTTTYYVHWTTAICGNSACASVTVNVTDPPTTANAGSDQSLCGVHTATLDGNQPSSGSGLWTQVAGPGSSTFTNNTQYNSQVTVPVYGDYTFRWTISTGTECPPSFDDVDLTFGDAITVTAGSNSPVCEGDTIFLTSSIANATYSWTGPNGFISNLQNPVILNAALASEGNYVITVTGIPGGCPATSDNTFVDMLPNPLAPASATVIPDTVCSGYAGNIQLTAVGGTGDEVYWYDGSCNGSIVGTGISINIPAPSVTTTYYASWTTTQCGSSSCTTTDFTVLDPPSIANAGPDQSWCGVLSTVMAANNPVNGSGLWSTVSGPGSVVFSDPTAYNSMITASAQGTYVLRWTISNGTTCPVSQDDVSVNFGDAIGVEITSNSPVCTGFDIILTPSITGASYSWTGPNGFTSSMQNPVIPNAVLANGGVYRVEVTGIPGGCPDTANTTTVVVNQSAGDPVFVSADVDTICLGYTGNITLTAGGGYGNELQWFSGSCGGTAIGTGTPLIIPAPATTTTYFARWVSDFCGNSNCLATTIVVAQPPTPAFAGTDQSICNLMATMLQGNQPLIGEGLWTVLSGPGTVSCSDPTIPNPIISVSLMGVYNLRWTISNGTLCPASEDDVTVEFGDMITVNAGSNGPICEGDTLKLYSSIAGAAYSWTGPAGFSSTLQNPVIPDATVANSGDYIITVTGIPGGCPNSSDSTSVEVGIIPSAPEINSQNITGNQQEVCEGSIFTYNIVNPIAGSDYAWSVTGGGFIEPSGVPDLVDIHWTASGGTYDLTVTETNVAGCTGSAATLAVTITPAITPAISISADNNPACSGTAVTFTTLVSGTGVSPQYLWQVNGVDAGSDSVFLLTSPMNNDLVTCLVTSANPCAVPSSVTSNALLVTVLDPLKISISDEDLICAGTPTLLSPAEEFASYLWSDGSTGSSITVQEPGVYWLLITDTAGCTASDTVTLEPCAVLNIYAPNAFTPDGDGINDEFMVFISNPDMISNFQMDIYNRWGQRLFRTDSMGNGWDGIMNGIACNSDVYTYVIIYNISGKSGETKQKAGTFTLVR